MPKRVTLTSQNVARHAVTDDETDEMKAEADLVVVVADMTGDHERCIL